jgi:hypothetical protein|tara:strand:+ start:187 stop:831 length:645 start_codon:yes stop_codon:yes gene_type:complete
MAVPSSGTISLFGLAKEKTHDNYANSIPLGTWQSYYFPNASLKDATTGAGNYDATNLNSSSRPDNSSPYGMSEWYGYDHDAIDTGGCAYNGTMYAVPILGSPTSSSRTYHFSSPSAAITAGRQQRFNSSSWSTAYIHQCAGSTWTIGNNIFTSNSPTGNQIARYKTGWRVLAHATQTFYYQGYPGDTESIAAVYDSDAQPYNMEEVMWYYEMLY